MFLVLKIFFIYTCASLINILFSLPFCLFRLITVDEHGLNSPELDIIIVYCSLCSGHGTCDFDNVREDSVDGFQYATCVCTEHWTGKCCQTCSCDDICTGMENFQIFTGPTYRWLQLKKKMCWTLKVIHFVQRSTNIPSTYLFTLECTGMN